MILHDCLMCNPASLSCLFGPQPGRPLFIDFHVNRSVVTNGNEPFVWVHLLVSKLVLILKAEPDLTQDIAYNHSAGTSIDCRCLIFSGIAENDEMVAVEHFIDVGNILGKSWVSLYQRSKPFE